MQIEKLKDSFQRTLSELYEIGGDWTDISTDELKFVIDCLIELEAYRKQEPVDYDYTIKTSIRRITCQPTS